MREDERQERSCPLCGRLYSSVPALSRKDNKTLICPDCGTREALESIGVNKEEQDHILELIHKSYGDGIK